MSDTTGKAIGVVGLGNMGYPMAGRLAERGFAVSVYDIDRSVADRFRENFMAGRRWNRWNWRDPLTCSSSCCLTAGLCVISSCRKRVVSQLLARSGAAASLWT